ncbi:MAG TPA: TauD/TfdA family dioxygenase [Streptosporangiaceae bacterium]|nr:TauD/TfdA family dioxygenase [Streptosporangiaceae bacterium]
MVTLSEKHVADKHVAALAPGETERLWQAAHVLVRSADVENLPPDDLVNIATALAPALPAEVLRRLHRYRSSGDCGDALLIRGLLPPGIDWGRNPGGSGAPLRDEHPQAAALCLLTIAAQLGEPFTFSTFYSGQLVQHVVPVPGMEHTQTSESSDGTLNWHVEDGWSGNRCDYFTLLCLRGDRGANTMFAAARDVALPASQRKVLADRARFVMWPDSAHALAERTGTPTAVLCGPEHDPQICFDAHYLGAADPADTEAAAALAALSEELDANRIEHTLEPGELLLLDNRRTAHARSSFRPGNDGNDRWLLRTMICSSLPRFRRNGTRII